MNKIKLEIDYKRKPEDVEKASNISLTIDYINFYVNGAHKAGLKGQMSRMWGRIQRKLDDAEVAQSPMIELEETEFEFIKKAVESDDILYPTNLSKYFSVFEDEVFSLNEEKK